MTQPPPLPHTPSNDGENVVGHGDRSERTEALEESTVVPVIVEQLDVRIEEHTTGRIRIQKHVDTERHEVPTERIDRGFRVERQAVGKLLDEAPPAVRQEGDATVYTVVREVPVVVTRYELVEEIRVVPEVERSSSKEHVELRRERVDIRRE